MQKIKYLFIILLTFSIIALGLMSPDITSSYYSQQLFNRVEPCNLDAINLDSKEELSTIKRLNLLQKYTSIITLNSDDYDLNQVQTVIKEELNSLFSKLEISINLDNYEFTSLEIICNIDQPHENSILYWNFTLLYDAYDSFISAIIDAETNQILSIYFVDNTVYDTNVNYKSQISSIFTNYVNYLGITNYLNPFENKHENYNDYKNSANSSRISYSDEDSNYFEGILWETSGSSASQNLIPNLDDDNIDSYFMAIAWGRNFFSLN